MTIVANTYAHVVGVDTHARTHTYAVVVAATGQVADTATFPTSPPGSARATAWMNRRAGEGRVPVSVEGASSYGAGPARALHGAGIGVCEVRPPRRTSQRGRGKSDAIDAVAAAQAVLVRTTALGVDGRQALTDGQIRTIAAWRERPRDNRAERIARDEARRLARAVLALTAGLETNREQLSDIAEDMAPGLMDLPGLGPVTSAIVLAAYSHHGRIRSEAAFAAIAGVNPIQAPSGNTVRHRPDRHGDRQPDQALHTIARTRMQFDPTTKDHVARRTAEGKSRREIRRCLKRFIARQLFRKPQTVMA